MFFADIRNRMPDLATFFFTYVGEVVGFIGIIFCMAVCYSGLTQI